MSRERFIAWTLTAPGVILVFLLTLGPVAWAIFMSFHRFQPARSPTPEFVGLDSYMWVLTNDRFWHAIENFLYYGVVGTAVQIILAMALAFAIYNTINNRTIRLAVVIIIVMPMMFASVVVAGVWQLMYSPAGGVVNGLLNLVGLPSIQWLGSRWPALTGLMIADIWQWTGYPFIIIYSARASIPDSMYEAARIDGASTWMTFRRITLPQIMNLLIIAILLKLIAVYKLFDKLLVLTAGGPGTATELPTYLNYVVGLQQFQVGRGAAMTILLVMALVVLLYGFWRLSAKHTEPGQ